MARDNRLYEKVWHASKFDLDTFALKFQGHSVQTFPELRSGMILNFKLCEIMASISCQAKCVSTKLNSIFSKTLCIPSK